MTIEVFINITIFCYGGQLLMTLMSFAFDELEMIGIDSKMKAILYFFVPYYFVYTMTRGIIKKINELQ